MACAILIYNPWSVLNLIARKKFAAYWADTSFNALVGKLIRKGDPSVKMDKEALLSGKSIRARIDEQIVFDQLDGNVDAIWSLLLAGGYLKVDKFSYVSEDGEDDGEYELSLTNRETRVMFRKLIRGWFKGEKNGYNEFVKALLLGDVEGMNVYMNEIALNSFSSFDSGSRLSGQMGPERFYHGFVLRLMVGLRDRYVVRSNWESGFGRYHVMLEPREGKEDLPAIVLEFKVFNSRREKTLEETVQAALEQIEEKRYDAELTERGFAPERIRHYGFAFRGKEVLIG